MENESEMARRQREACGFISQEELARRQKVACHIPEKMCTCGHAEISHSGGSCEFNSDNGYDGKDACLCVGFEEQ